MTMTHEGGRTILSSLFALALVAAVPVAALAQEADESNARLIDIVPADAESDAAAEIADLAAGGEDADAGEAAAAENAAEEAVEEAVANAAPAEEAAGEEATGDAGAEAVAAESLADVAEGTEAPGADAFAALKLDTALGAVEVQELLEGAGYEVQILKSEAGNKYQLLAKGADGLEDLWLHLDGNTGAVLKHEYVDAADYEDFKDEPKHEAPAYANPGYANPGYAKPGYYQAYRPAPRRNYYNPGPQYRYGGYSSGYSGSGY